MKKIFFTTLVTLASVSPFAETIYCKDSKDATAQGYEITASKTQAIILLKGHKIADLVFVGQIGSQNIESSV